MIPKISNAFDHNYNLKEVTQIFMNGDNSDSHFLSTDAKASEIFCQ